MPKKDITTDIRAFKKAIVRLKKENIIRKRKIDGRKRITVNKNHRHRNDNQKLSVYPEND